MHLKLIHSLAVTALVLGVCGSAASADGVQTYGDIDCMNAASSCYGATNPEAGATLQGLAPGVTSSATNKYGNPYPFTPTASDFAHTDQIFVGSGFSGSGHDGYSGDSPTKGPATFTLNYSGLVTSGTPVTSLTLGIAANDFQQPSFGDPFTATINGTVDTALTNLLNSTDQTGPYVQFFTVGLPLADVNASHTLNLSIDEGGDGGDGYAVDFLTVGVNTGAPITATPEPSSALLMALAGALALVALRSRLFLSKSPR